MTDIDRSAGARIGQIQLAAGVRISHFWTYMYASLISIGMLTTMNFSQPYILTEHLGITDQSVAGMVTGRLTGITEIVSLFLIWPFGMLADRIGRRPVIMLGIGLLGLSYALYPWATEVSHLMYFRIIFGVGVAATAAMTATIQNDYPVETSRGRVIGFSSAFNALGIVFATRLVSALPKWLQDSGMDPVAAGRYAYGAAALVCFVSLVIFRIGLKGGVPEEVRKRPPWIELVKSGFRQARNPRILLAYACAATSRGDMVVSGLFVSLWATMAVKAAGGEAAVAQYQVFLPFAVIQVFAVVFSFVFGSILDKVNRVVGLVLALALCVAGYGAMYFVESPLDLKILPLFAVLGCAMAAAMMSSMALIGQEAPPRERGAVIGLMSVFGSVGIILSAGVGGMLFSASTPWAPFVLMAGAQAVLLVWALLVWLLAPGERKVAAATASS